MTEYHPSNLNHRENEHYCRKSEDALRFNFKLVNLPLPPFPEEGPVPLEGVVPLLSLQSNLSAVDCDIPGHNPLSKEHPAKTNQRMLMREKKAKRRNSGYNLFLRLKQNLRTESMKFRSFV